MKLSTCLILRNEGPTIYRCLDSVKTFTDEYVIGIDKKTDDNTRDEVNRFFKDNKTKNIIYDYEWKSSFAKARNFGMDKATSDYIMIMDGHEYVADEWYSITDKRLVNSVDLVKKFVLKQVKDDQPDEVYFSLYQQPFTGQIPNNYFMQPRIYRNGKGKDGKMIRYGRDAHNVIRWTDPNKSIQFPEIIIIHDAPEENRLWRKEQRLSMNIGQLKKDIDKNARDTRALFYLGNTYMEAKDWKKAVAAFNKYLKLAKGSNNSEKYQCLLHFALTSRELKRDEDALQALFQALRVDNTRRDAYVIIGDILNEQEQFVQAIHSYNNALLLPPKISRMFSNGAVNTWMPYYKIATAFYNNQEMQKAIAHLKKAMDYVVCTDWTEKLKEWSGNTQNILIIDSIGSFTKPFMNYLNDKGYNVIRQKRYSPTLAEWADVIWQEWADENIVNNSFLSKTVMRVHGYEAYLNAHILNNKAVNQCKKVVFVAKHIQDMFKIPNSTVVKQGVDTEKFYIKNWDRDYKQIGYAGYMNVKKNPLRLAEVIKANPQYIFNLRIDWQDPFLESTFTYETKDCKNIVHHARYDDLNDFWNKMSGVISTSDIESFSYNVAEGMACGCTPYIYPWKGASEIWRAEDIMPEFKFKECENGSHRKTMTNNRQYIIDTYPLQKANEAMEAVLVK